MFLIFAFVLGFVYSVILLTLVPNIISGTQTLWVSDGFYTVRMMILDDVDPADNESGEHVNEGSPTVSGFDFNAFLCCKVMVAVGLEIYIDFQGHNTFSNT